MDERQLVIIGSGPAGHTAGIYSARANLEPLMYEGFFAGPAGGQLMTTTDVENYPGFPEGIGGPALMDNMRNQSLRFGCEILTEDVKALDLTTRPFTIHGKKTESKAHSLIIATGATAKTLDIEGTREGELWQKGVSACAVCDGAMPMFRQGELYVIGGGDTAMEEALFLTKYASKVYIVHRRDQLRASKIMAERALEHPKIEVIWNHVVVKASGSSRLEELTIKNTQTSQTQKCKANGLFFAIGHQPNTGFLGDEIKKSESGYIIVGSDSTQTSVEGVFAAGDVYDYRYRQAVTAAGSGCKAAMDAEQYLLQQGLLQ